MWIRSQDRKFLVNTDLVFMDMPKTYDGGEWVIDKSKCKIFVTTHDSNTSIGTYKTEERALEVLDEIQKNIIDSNVTNYEYFYTENQRLLEYTYKLKTVYEMPKE